MSQDEIDKQRWKSQGQNAQSRPRCRISFPVEKKDEFLGLKTQQHGAGHGYEPQADSKYCGQRLRSRTAQPREENRDHRRRKKTGSIHEPEDGRVLTNDARVPEPLQKEKIEAKINSGGQYAQADGKDLRKEPSRK